MGYNDDERISSLEERTQAFYERNRINNEQGSVTVSWVKYRTMELKAERADLLGAVGAHHQRFDAFAQQHQREFNERQAETNRRIEPLDKRLQEIVQELADLSHQEAAPVEDQTQAAAA